jgi:CHRD domain
MALIHRSGRLLFVLGAAFTVLALGASAQEPHLFKKFCGRVSIFAIRFDYPNPALLAPDNEDCTNGVDDDMDGQADYADQDCLAGLGPQDIYLKTPFDVVQPIGGLAPARFTGMNRNGDPLGELLINSTGPGGRKLSYLRTRAPDVYGNVTVAVVVLPGKTGDQGGPVAIRIQAADAAAHAGMCYFVRTVPGNKVTIEKELGNGTTVELASKTEWASGAPIAIEEYDDLSPPDAKSYRVVFSAVGSSLTATVSEVSSLGPIFNNFDVQNDHTVTLTASDGDLPEGYVGLRSDNDVGGPVVDDVQSGVADPSILDYAISDPDERRPTGAPRIAFFNSFSSQLDGNLDYTTTPIGAKDQNVYNRSTTTDADASLAAYLRSLGFQVDEYHIGSFAAGIFAPDFINENYDLFWLPSSGASSDTRNFVRSITIPFIFAEHVDGSAMFGGLWAGNGNLNGNESQVGCGPAAFTATLNGANEAPDPVVTSARGFGVFPYNAATHVLSFNIEFSGLSSPEQAAHIHQGPVGVPGPVIHPLPPGNPKVGSVTLTPDEEADLLAGNLYVNIHSRDHGSGEIRGQLTPGTLSPTSIRIISEEKGGNPDHPIVRGLADENGNVAVHDSSQFPLNLVYAFPGEGPAGLTGAGFKTVKQILDERGWGPGCPETQFAGYPTAPGAVALAAMNNPCTGEPFWQTDDTGNLTSPDGKGHIALVAAEAGTPKVVLDPENCPDLCIFDHRVVFYWLSDRAFPYSTKSTLSILRRSALWALGLLDSPNRSDVPFKRGDANADGAIDLSDAIFTLSWLFTGGQEPTCRDAADTNDDEKADISDAVVSLGFLFLGGQAPGFPFQSCFQGCGLDLTPPAPGPGVVEDPASILSCNEYQGCRS